MKNLSHLPSTRVIANDVQQQNTATSVWANSVGFTYKQFLFQIFLQQRHIAIAVDILKWYFSQDQNILLKCQLNTPNINGGLHVERQLQLENTKSLL